jgi:hypothetical protein
VLIDKCKRIKEHEKWIESMCARKKERSRLEVTRGEQAGRKQENDGDALEKKTGKDGEVRQWCTKCGA